jgi:general secretion pathway protein A
MYQEYFGFTTSPFELSPDPAFFFSSEKSMAALASISYAISSRKGFVVMTGEVGTGKTLLLRCLLELWEREELPCVYCVGPRLSTMDFLQFMAIELGIRITDPTKGALLRALYGFLLAQFEKDLTTVLIIDEAHQIPPGVLEEIRLLANFETAQQKLLQVLLVGQPELDEKLDSTELRSLKQRIAVRCQLTPLRAEEARLYILRRLELAGAGALGSTLFPPETMQAIHNYSLGIPRLINCICEQALMSAYTRKIRTIPVEIIADVAFRFRLAPASELKRSETFSQASQMGRSIRDGSLRRASPLEATTGGPAAPQQRRPLEAGNSGSLTIASPNARNIAKG